MKAFHAIVTAILVLFFAIMVIFRLVDGSFESAGARMDRMMGVAADEASSAADEVVEATDAAVEDIAADIANERDEN
ncbi:MAG: hypothetical protein B7X53_00895 [Hyphomonas sp. 34-62-18]|nr:hypothetical protein [Hyphomonas sp. 34-62-18]OZB19244.1 MAG: hypothetical protein B7X53_00895 [Hyphomonas sp. 34-62-18]